MPTTTQSPNRPEDLPIWARLNLANEGVPFGDVSGWEHETKTRIIAFIDNGRYVYLYKR